MKQQSLLNLAAPRASTPVPPEPAASQACLIQAGNMGEPLRQKMTVLLSLRLLRDKPWPTMQTSCNVDRDIYTIVPLCLSVRRFVRLLVSQSVCPSVCPSVPPSVSHPVCLFLCLSVCPFVSLSVRPSVCLVIQSVRLSVRLFVRLLVSQSVCFSVCQSVRQSVCLSAIPSRVYNDR